jgi:hypothetical protein
MQIGRVQVSCNFAEFSDHSYAQCGNLLSAVALLKREKLRASGGGISRSTIGAQDKRLAADPCRLLMSNGKMRGIFSGLAAENSPAL